MRHPIAAALRALALALLLSTPAAAAGTDSGARAPASSLIGVVNVNSATAEELSLLPGVGPAKAAAIIRYRTEHGAFKRVEDLSQVKGIGEKQVEKLRPHVALEGKTTAQPAKAAGK
ncbi:MAG TPA: helix-hairpin-helix domain-containing protein [Myxococcota bacterium]|nr:helix-hairpin-helix domain-containing protein [Myxococcota bacterium]